jgi:hypothetical protein
LHAQQTPAASRPIIERPVAFDASGRVTVLTPSLAARWKLPSPLWPLGTDWTEARLFATDSTESIASSTTLVATRVDGAHARYAMSRDDLAALRQFINTALVAQGAVADSARGSTGFVVSTPAGNAFVRNQIVLGLTAYGPATAAIFSGNGTAAGGGYLLAAGTSALVAARLVRDRSVTRAQSILAFHAGTRGALMGAAVAGIADATGGTGYGVPILAGALGGTLAGFQGARGMSDGEAASSGFAADLFALTTLGISGAADAFEANPADHTGNRLQSKGKAALGASILTGVAGYLVGPRYARRAAYNVTDGDIDVAFTSAAIGIVAANGVVGGSGSDALHFGASTGGMLLGALVADLTKVRHADRTSADGALVQVLSIAGALMGGGIALTARMESPAALITIAAGGAVGLSIGDYVARPARDAGAKGGVLSRDGLASRVSLSLLPAAASLAIHSRTRDARVPITAHATVSNAPLLRIAF